ncbi:serine threonine- kinase endoribonuclease IRE1-like, partial [Paramuricea clavata]
NRPHPSSPNPLFNDSDPRLQYSLQSVDPRIHFGLVCGAKSCPAINVYSTTNLERGLKVAAENFCSQEVHVDMNVKRVTLSKIFLWYKSDFAEDDIDLLRSAHRYVKTVATCDSIPTKTEKYYNKNSNLGKLLTVRICNTMAMSKSAKKSGINEFLIEVTQELLYNIVFEANEIKYDVLSKKFKDITGHRPMDFFGFGNKTGRGWFEFIKEMPGLKGERKISISNGDDGNEDIGDSNSDEEFDYKTFNTTYLKENGVNISSVAKYRGMLLTECCQIMKDNFNDLGNCKDGNGNTPLHFIAALPGLSYDCSTLVKDLLEAGVDPLATNKDGQNFLHIIMGRCKAKWHTGAMCFSNDVSTREHVPATKWFVEDRVELLDLLAEELSQAQTSLLVKAQDTSGNTVMHEFALASPIEENFNEVQICQKVLKFGASLRVPTNFGDLPLHYALNPSVYDVLDWEGRLSWERNDSYETPVLFILKYSADLFFAETSAYSELNDNVSLSTMNKRSVHKAIKLLKNLTEILEKYSMPTLAWIPDREGTVVISILLISIRLASYKLEPIEKNDSFLYNTHQLRLLLVELLRTVLRDAKPSDMKRQNGRSEGFLHALLNMGVNNKHVIVEEAEMLHSLEILLKHKVDVNAVDLMGNTPLDITYELQGKCPNLYKKCAEMLMEKGATSKNITRKLRSCPNRHLNNAQRLTDPNCPVTVIEKYRYSNQDSIGNGAFSNIFVAIKDENVESTSGTIECRAFALKRIDKAKINPQEIKREITTLLRISGKCENIIEYHEFVEDSFFQYLCLDLMDGDLNEFVTNNGDNKVLRENPAIPVRVTKEIIDGLAFLHEQKYIHRDLKPGNILYTTDQCLQFKIADFGLTKNMSTFSTMTSTRGSGIAMAPGTRCWMAPELVCMKSRDHTEKSDLFSMGLVIHYLLTLGKHPFATGSEERAHVIERNIEEVRLNLDKSLHPEAISFLENLLRRDPFKRPPANMLKQHPFLWSETKKIEFLKAVGDQPEAERRANHPNSALEQRLQMTQTGQSVSFAYWNVVLKDMYDEMIKTWKSKKYRTNKLIDLIRFIRNTYSHRQDKSLQLQQDLDKNIFLHKYPSIVLDVLSVVQELGFHEDESRNNIRQALSLNT